MEQKATKSWVSEEFYLYHVENLRKVSKELDGGFHYSLVLIFGGVNVMEAVRTVRRISRVPILVVRKRYDGPEKIAVLETGADEYIQYPAEKEDGLCIIPEYRQVFVNSREVIFPGKEFDLLHTLVSSPERVFTYEQLFYLVWREEGDFAESSMHSCIKRIRRRLESVPDLAAGIENVRGVGYRYKEKIPH